MAITIITTATIHPVRQKTFELVRFLTIIGKSLGLARQTQINTAIANINFGAFSMMAIHNDFFTGAHFLDTDKIQVKHL
jgi:hypothetical protein